MRRKLAMDVGRGDRLMGRIVRRISPARVSQGGPLAPGFLTLGLDDGSMVSLHGSDVVEVDEEDDEIETQLGTLYRFG